MALSLTRPLQAQNGLVPCQSSGTGRDVVVFVNGVYNSLSDARDNCADLGRRLIASGIDSPKILLFYNRTQLSAWRECEAAVREADESFRRTRVDVPRRLVVRPGSAKGGTIGTGPVDHISVPESALRQGCYQLEDIAEAAAQFNNIDRGYATSSQPDALALSAALDELLVQPDRRVAVVTHSQGNLTFQEAVFGRGSRLDAKERQRIGWISVSAPLLRSSPAIGGFSSVVLPGDPILRLRANDSERTSAAGWRSVIEGKQHLFSTYLAAMETRVAIVDGVRVFLRPASPVGAIADRSACSSASTRPAEGTVTTANVLRQPLCVTFPNIPNDQKSYELASSSVRERTSSNGQPALLLAVHGKSIEGMLLPAAVTLARWENGSWRVIFTRDFPPAPPESDAFAGLIRADLTSVGGHEVLVITTEAGFENDWNSVARVIEPNGLVVDVNDTYDSLLERLYSLGLPRMRENERVIFRGAQPPGLELRVALMRQSDRWPCPTGGEYAFEQRIVRTASGYQVAPVRLWGRRDCSAR